MTRDDAVSVALAILSTTVWPFCRCGQHASLFLGIRRSEASDASHVKPSSATTPKTNEPDPRVHRKKKPYCPDAGSTIGPNPAPSVCGLLPVRNANPAGTG